MVSISLIIFHNSVTIFKYFNFMFLGYFGNVYARQTAQQIFQNATDAGLTTGIISGTPDKE